MRDIFEILNEVNVLLKSNIKYMYDLPKNMKKKKEVVKNYLNSGRKKIEETNKIINTLINIQNKLNELNDDNLVNCTSDIIAVAKNQVNLIESYISWHENKLN